MDFCTIIYWGNNIIKKLAIDFKNVSLDIEDNNIKIQNNKIILKTSIDSAMPPKCASQLATVTVVGTTNHPPQVTTSAPAVAIIDDNEATLKKYYKEKGIKK